MPDWRFKLLIIFAALGVPLYFLGFTLIAMQITNRTFAILLWVTCLIGTTGGTFIHGLLCCFPALYKKIKKKYGFDSAEDTLNCVYDNRDAIANAKKVLVQ